MAESTIKAQKAPLKKTVTRKKSTAKKITLKKFDDTKPVVKTAPQTIAKSTVKKPPVKKSVKSPPAKPDDSLETIKSLVHEMRREHNKRDQQITAMVHEISQGFSHFAEQADGREERSLDILKALTDTLQADHEKNRQETQHQQKLNHESIQQTARRNRLIAIPAAVIAVLTIVTILYVVNMLGTAMTNISTDINQIQISVKEISTRMDSISLDTNSMSGNIQQLNRNVTTMSKDLSVLSYTVAPTMRGMRNVMPWAPE